MARQPAAKGEQHAVTNGEAEALIDVLEAVDVDEHHRRAIGLAFASAGYGPLQAVEEQLAIGQAGQAVMHGVVHQALMRTLEAGDVAHQSDAAQQPRVARYGAGAQVVPEIAPVLTLEAEFGLQIASGVLLKRPQHQAEALAVSRVHVLEEIVDRGVERAWRRPKRFLDLAGDRDVILGGVPLPYRGAGAVDGERLDLNLADRPKLEGSCAGRTEGELGDGKAEQHEDEDKAGRKAGYHDVARQLAEYDHCRPEQPDEQQHPTWDEQQRAILAAQREIGDEASADGGDADERPAGKSGGHPRIDKSQHHEGELGSDPAPEQGLDPAVPESDAKEGIEKEHKARSYRCLRRRAIDRDILRADREQLAPIAEVHAEIGKHRPGDERGCRKDGAVVGGEDRGEKDREQAGDA